MSFNNAFCFFFRLVCGNEVTPKSLAVLNEWGFSNKMLDLTRHIDSVRNA